MTVKVDENVISLPPCKPDRPQIAFNIILISYSRNSGLFAYHKFIDRVLSAELGEYPHIFIVFDAPPQLDRELFYQFNRVGVHLMVVAKRIHSWPTNNIPSCFPCPAPPHKRRTHGYKSYSTLRRLQVSRSPGLRQVHPRAGIRHIGFFEGFPG